MSLTDFENAKKRAMSSSDFLKPFCFSDLFYDTSYPLNNYSESPQIYFVPSMQQETASTIEIKRDAILMDLFFAINNIFDEIIENSVDLDNKTKDIVYSNLWELYE